LCCGSKACRRRMPRAKLRPLNMREAVLAVVLIAMLLRQIVLKVGDRHSFAWQASIAPAAGRRGGSLLTKDGAFTPGNRSPARFIPTSRASPRSAQSAPTSHSAARVAAADAPGSSRSYRVHRRSLMLTAAG
jgi:hypothetical protein